MTQLRRTLLALVTMGAAIGFGTGQAWADDNARDWGANSHGQLGDGTTYNRLGPVPITGMAAVIAAAGGQYHSVILKSDGTAWAWGHSTWGTVGDGTTTTRLTPVQVSGVAGAAAIAAGALHNLALLADGTVRAWGANGNGAVGDGTTTDRWASVPIPALTSVVAVAAGGYHSLALRSDGTVWAWGANWIGQLGDGTRTLRSTPTQVPGLTGIVAIAGGATHSLALRSDGTVWAWGENESGQLGDGTNALSLSPVQVSGLSGATAIAGGGHHSLAVISGGAVSSWGGNIVGQLGDGTTTNTNIPVQVSGLAGCVAVAGGGLHSIALRADGTAWAWGFNERGELGDNTGMDKWTPVQIAGITGVVSVAAGANHGLAVLPARTSSAIYAPDRTGIVTTTAALTGHLSRLSDNAGLEGRSLEFAIDGVPIGSANTDANGIAVHNWIIDVGPAARIIRVDFAGDTQYSPSSTTAPLTTRTVATKVHVLDRTARIRSYVVLKAYLFLLDNTTVPSKPMSIKVDGTVVGLGATNASGVLPIGYVVAEGAGAGPRSIRGEFAGDAGFMSSAGQRTLSVTRGNLSVWAYVRTGRAGAAHPLKAYVRSLPDYVIQPGKSIAFSVNGTAIGAMAAAADGWATVTWPIPVGEPAGAHTVVADFAGDAWYLPVTVSTTFNVTP